MPYDLSYDDLVLENDDDKVHEIIDDFIQEMKKKDALKKQRRVRGRGRPRKHFTKKVSMIEMDPSGSVLIKAGRGRPGKFEKRVEVTIPLDVEVGSEGLYMYVNGTLEELK